jgi:hypothetical protein
MSGAPGFLNMKRTVVTFLLAVVFAAVLLGAAGCAEPENASVRPWNSPEGFEGGALGGMNYQHQ